MADIHHKLDMYVKDSFQFKSVIIVAGGNHASLPSDKFKSDVSAAALTTVIRAAKSLAPDVTVAAIPPRAQPSHAMENIDILNEIFKSVSEEMSVTFATNDEHFFLRNGSINEGYLYDSVHLTFKGANKILVISITLYALQLNCIFLKDHHVSFSIGHIKTLLMNYL